jgi:hypothetical protein
MTSDFAANDFAAIAAGMRALKCETVEVAPKTPWWCGDCQRDVDGRDVTYQERHDERAGGCGCIVYPSCGRCENGGWVQVYSPCPPAFEQCPACFNPFGTKSP